MSSQDKILIRDLRVRGVIGVDDWERRARQDIVINLVLYRDARAAERSDRIGDALNYDPLTRAIIEYAESSQHRLLEALAGQIARICIVDYGAERALVRLEKPAAVRFAVSAGIEIERTRADFAP
jgi:FolB domain-containing protein